MGLTSAPPTIRPAAGAAPHPQSLVARSTQHTMQPLEMSSSRKFISNNSNLFYIDDISSDIVTFHINVSFLPLERNQVRRINKLSLVLGKKVLKNQGWDLRSCIC